MTYSSIPLRKLLACIIVLIGLGLFAGCATPSISKAEMDRWIGRNKTALIDVYGAPLKEEVIPSVGNALTFKIVKNFHIDPQLNQVNDASYIVSSARDITVTHIVTFVVNADDIVVAWRERKES